MLTHEQTCSKCGGTSFAEGTDYMPVKPLGKKFALGSNKIYTFCLNCGEVLSIRLEHPERLKGQGW